MRHSRIFFLFLSTILFLIAWSFLSRAVPIQADSLPSSDNPLIQDLSVKLQVATETETPTPIPMEFTPQEIAEGRPTGIIIGAAALVLLIFLGSLITLRRTVSKK